MLNQKFKQYILARKSIFLDGLRKHGFNDQEILAALAILISFHQNVASYIDTGTEEPKITDNFCIHFNIAHPDPRNFIIFHTLQGQSASSAKDKEVLSYVLQMYGIYRIFSTIYQSMLANPHHTDEQVATSVIEDITKTCKAVMHMEAIDINNPEFIRNITTFTKVVLGIDYHDIKQQIYYQIKIVKANYLKIVGKLNNTLDQTKVKKFLVMVIYKDAIRYFGEIHSSIFSNKFHKEMPAILTPISGAYDSSLCNIVYENKNASKLTKLILSAYKDIFYAIYQDCLNFCNSDYLMLASTSQDINCTMRSFENLQTTGIFQIIPRHHTSFISCDISYAISSILNTPVAIKLNILHVINAIYKEALLQKFILQSATTQDILSDLHGAQKQLSGYLLELLAICYYAAFYVKLPASQIKECYDTCYTFLLKIANTSYKKQVKLLSEYELLFNEIQAKLHCSTVSIYNQNTQIIPHNMVMLLQHLTFNEGVPYILGNTRLSYQMIACCSTVNERKARQIAVTMCRVLGQHSLDPTNYSSSVLIILLKLCFGNFLEKSFIIRLFDIAYVAYNNPETLLSRVASQEMNKFYLALSLLANLLNSEVNNLHCHASANDFAQGNAASFQNYITIYGVLDAFSEESGVDTDHLVTTQNTLYSTEFCNKTIKGAVLRMQLVHTTEGKEISCQHFDISLFKHTLQLAACYVSSFTDEQFSQHLCTAQTSSLQFLLFNILVSGPVVRNIDLLCGSAKNLQYPLLRAFEEGLQECVSWDSASSIITSQSPSTFDIQRLVCPLVDKNGDICLSHDVIKQVGDNVLSDQLKFSIDQDIQPVSLLVKGFSMDQLYIPNIYPTAQSLAIHYPHTSTGESEEIDTHDSYSISSRTKKTKQQPTYLNKKTICCVFAAALIILFSIITISLLYYFEVDNKEIMVNIIAIASAILTLSMIAYGILSSKPYYAITDENNNGEHDIEAQVPNTITVTEDPKNPSINSTDNTLH
ncbi:putative integral membrane protein [Ehrlichia ruminantium]|uniref:Putative integral membrane protein n=1 Tax=Ehrlichia ruminantium TaxID=779 RepID=A0A170TBP5_EHRRU|nr:hypothetical protein [Ehrlichia ruminantium]GAT78744.1 putative integral membrane protein [Ehrlichia ruminantium]